MKSTHAALLAGFLLVADGFATEPSRVRFDSSDAVLNAGFAWAKQQALSCVHHGDAVGDWYDASLPRRDAFCMRDVSHQALGAQVLGLAAVNRNMLRKFAQNVAASRQWCSFWEINKDDLPAPLDYKTDADFWYNLPANFDVLHACYRQYLWTGDKTYLNDAAFLNFYRRTTNDYIRAWDMDGDGIPDALPQYGHRGIPSYNEGMANHPRQAADLLATEYAALLAAGKLNVADADELNGRAQQIRNIYNRTWWNQSQRCFYTAKLQDGSFYAGRIFEPDFFPVYLDQLPEDGDHLQGQLRIVAEESHDSKINVEAFSYFPEILYRWRMNEDAYRCLVRLVDPALKRREYPEVSFAAVGAYAAGLMGIEPNGAERMVSTLSHLTKATEWALMEHMPVFEGEISVQHKGTSETTLANEGSEAIRWKAEFPMNARRILVDGKEDKGARGKSFVVVNVAPKQSVTVRADVR